MTRDEADNAANWRDMDGVCAYLNIKHSATNWQEVGKQMDAWMRARINSEREANSDRTRPHRRNQTAQATPGRSAWRHARTKAGAEQTSSPSQGIESTDNLDRRKAVFLLERTLDKYTPEIILGAFFVLKNIVLIVACAWTTVRLYELSGSWHSLWALLMLLAVGSYRFVRD